MRREVAGDVHLVGGPSTIAAFAALGALDRLEVVVLPIVLGRGRPLLPPGTPEYGLRLEGSRPVGDDSVELAYGLSPAQ
jgi:dihydrofolate reductase